MIKNLIEKYETREKMAESAAENIAEIIVEKVEKNGFCTVGLSGGSSPMETLKILATKSVSWKKVTFIEVDERRVEPENAENNARNLRENFFERLPCFARFIFFDTMVVPAAAMRKFENEVAELPKNKKFDLILLGIGADGHTASLFPGSFDVEDQNIACETETDVKMERSPDIFSLSPDGDRVIRHKNSEDDTQGSLKTNKRFSLTLRTILRAERIIFIVTGDKVGILEKIGEKNCDLPAGVVLGNGNVDKIFFAE